MFPWTKVSLLCVNVIIFFFPWPSLKVCSYFSFLCSSSPFVLPHFFFFFAYHWSFSLRWFAHSLNQHIQFAPNLKICFMNPLAIKIPMLLSSPVIAKMQGRKSCAPKLAVPHLISCYFSIPSTMFLKQQAAGFLPEPTTISELWRVEPQILH